MRRRKPKLSLVGLASTADGSPPSGNDPAKTAGHCLWEKLNAEYAFSIADKELLKQACVMTDRADTLAAQIESDGSVLYGTNGMPKSHPAIRDELQARAFVARTLARLGVIGDPNERKRGPGRPGYGGIGITWGQLQDRES